MWPPHRLHGYKDFPHRCTSAGAASLLGHAQATRRPTAQERDYIHKHMASNVMQYNAMQRSIM